MNRALNAALLGCSLLASSVVAPVSAVAGDRDHVSRHELRHDQRRIVHERRDVREAMREGDWREVREERRELGHAKREYRQDRRDWHVWRSYDYNRPDPYYGGYFANYYYRGGPVYRPIALGYRDRVYRGDDGRYYCRRSDGTTGLLIGAVTGGMLGNVIAPGDSKTLGTIVGAGFGGLVGRAIDRGEMRCR